MKNTSSTLSRNYPPNKFNHSSHSHESFTMRAKNLTPAVNFSFDEHYLSIKGSSAQANPTHFYSNLNNALDRFIETDNKELQVHLEFDFINSSSVSCLHKLMKNLRFMTYLGKEISVCWYYHKANGQIKKYGQTFQDYFPNHVHLIEQ